jgi:hypothetical protein
LQYHEIVPLDKAAAGELLLSGDEEKMVMGLLGAVEGDTEWRWVQDQCLRFVDDPRVTVARVAIMCLGHLARMERKLDLDKVMPVLEMCLKHENPAIQGVTEDTLSDIRIYCR